MAARHRWERAPLTCCWRWSNGVTGQSRSTSCSTWSGMGWSWKRTTCRCRSAPCARSSVRTRFRPSPGRDTASRYRPMRREAPSLPPLAGVGYRFTRAIGPAHSAVLEPNADAATAGLPSPSAPVQSMDSEPSRTDVLATAMPTKRGFDRFWQRGTRRWSTPHSPSLSCSWFWAEPTSGATNSRPRCPRLLTHCSRQRARWRHVQDASGQAFPCRPAIRQPRRQFGEQLLRRWHHRRHHHGPFQALRNPGRRTQLHFDLQGQVRQGAAGGQGTWRALRAGGSVRREGDTVRINAQLVDALGGQHLWAERYDGSIRDVFALQDKVIGQIVAALALSLTHDEQARVAVVETRNPQAYDAMLRGWGTLSPGLRG